MTATATYTIDTGVGIVEMTAAEMTATWDEPTVEVTGTDERWEIKVDGVVRGTFRCVFAAVREARRWGF